MSYAIPALSELSQKDAAEQIAQIADFLADVQTDTPNSMGQTLIQWIVRDSIIALSKRFSTEG